MCIHKSKLNSKTHNYQAGVLRCVRKILHSTFYILHSTRRGQAMLITVLAISGTLLGATTVAGLLMVYQLRQSVDAGTSAKAIFAADSGLEYGLYKFFYPTSTLSVPSFTNIIQAGDGVTVTCYSDSQGANPLPGCDDQGTALIRAVGKFGEVSRAFELSL